MHFWVISARLPISRVFIEHCPKFRKSLFGELLEERVYWNSF
ncbi:hypothetical protein HanPSC8_Chr12g0507561 [Helianthus annuus]|nr:hypothetical protein HanPSC8_Chr12g0507561 [Helianthus annuus]